MPADGAHTVATCCRELRSCRSTRSAPPWRSCLCRPNHMPHAPVSHRPIIFIRRHAVAITATRLKLSHAAGRGHTQDQVPTPINATHAQPIRRPCVRAINFIALNTGLNCCAFFPISYDIPRGLGVPAGTALWMWAGSAGLVSRLKRCGAHHLKLRRKRTVVHAFRGWTQNQAWWHL